MKLPNGKYKTLAGSIVEISGQYSGISMVDFDWFEESNSCDECNVECYPEDNGDGTHSLVWYCEECGGGSALLYPFKEPEEGEAA